MALQVDHSLTAPDLVAMRMKAQLLTDSSVDNPAKVVRHLFAMQGQDFDAARWGVAIRSGSTDKPASQDKVAEAFNSGQIVRSWPMRGTVHLMCAEDIGWMQQLTNPGVLKHWASRRDYLELELSDYERAREITLDALAGGKSLPRESLVELWEQSGIEVKKGWSYHLVWAMCQHGDIVFGPMNESGDLELTGAADWIKQPRKYDPDVAVTEFCVRYFTGHGPASMKDLVWWCQLPARTLKTGIAAASDRLVELEVNGNTYYATQEQLESHSPVKTSSRSPKPLMALTPFDEHLLGYKDRSLFLDPKNARKVMTVNGIAQPTILRDGRVVAAWKVRDGSYEVLDGQRLNKRELAATEARIQDAREWLGRA